MDPLKIPVGSSIINASHPKRDVYFHAGSFLVLAHSSQRVPNREGEESM